MAVKGYARPISKKEAKSYERRVPNARGVTTLLRVNGSRRGRARAHSSGYAQRYAKANRFLRNDADGFEVEPVTQRRPASPFRDTRGEADRVSPSARLVGVPIMSVGAAGAAPRTRKERKKTMAKKGKLRGAAKAAFLKRMASGRRKSGKTSSGGTVKKTARRSAGKRRQTPAQRAASKRNLAKGRAAMRGGRKGAAKTTRRAKGRSAHGPRYGTFNSLLASIGGKHFKTYESRTAKGRRRHIPMYALLGLKSQKELHAALSGPDEIAEKTAKKIAAIRKRREAAAARVLKHGDMFTPNEDGSFEMMRNGRKKGRRKLTKAHIAKMQAGRRAAAKRAGKSGSATKRKRTTRKAGKRRQTPKQRAASKRNLAKGRAAAKRKRSGKSGSATKRKRTTRKAGKRRQTPKQRAASKRNLAKGRAAARKRSGKRTTRKSAKRSSSRRISKKRAHREAQDLVMYTSNGRRRRRHHRRGRYTRNAAFASFGAALKVGAIAFGGFLAHRVLSRAGEGLLNRIGFFANPANATVKRGVADLLILAIGIPAAAMLAPSHAIAIGGGMVAATLHDLVTAGAARAYPTASQYLSGMGEYVPMNGYGAYELAPMNGFGGPMQAAAGMGQYFMQAAAGMGATPYMQAAAGYGATPYMQAAAGMGEFFLQGAQGVGEYEQTNGFGSPADAWMDEGIHPDMNSAEQALTVSEAAAGVNGFGDIPADSIVNPEVVESGPWQDDEDLRTGVLRGEGGIFG